MHTPLFLPQQGAHDDAIPIGWAEEPVSILSAIPFFADPDQAWAEAFWSGEEASTPQARKLRREVQASLSGSLAGITAASGHWSGSRADGERHSYNLDRDFLASGLVRRLTARLPLGPDVGEWMDKTEEQDGSCANLSRVHRSAVAYLHAADRAEYKIGAGLEQVAQALLPSGLLAEADLLHGDGRNRAERLLIRDALFASEDLTIEEMAYILKEAPYSLDEVRGDGRYLRSRDEAVTDRTPLIFVHCRGTEYCEGGKEVFLEAVDFQSIEILTRCLTIMRERDYGLHKKVQDMLFENYREPVLPRPRRKRR